MQQSDVKFPNFFLIGAPKCGTTALSAYLRTHPDIFFSRPKEPHYFDTDVRSRKGHRCNSLEEYARCFVGSAGHVAVGEGTVRYLHSSVAVKAILRFCPTAKFIVMLRHPVDMAHSMYHQHLRNDNEDARSFEEAWYLQDERRRGFHIPVNCAHPSLLQYEERCRLGDQIERLFVTVPDRSQVHLISFPQFCKSTDLVYRGVLKFLGVPRDQRIDFPLVNEYARVRSKLLERALDLGSKPGPQRISRYLKRRLGVVHWPVLYDLARMNYARMQKRPMSDEFRAMLTEHFRSDVEKAKRLTGIDLYA